MRCKGCNRDMEVRWHQPEGAPEPLLEDLCNLCKGWATCTLRAISATEEDPPVYWPKHVGIGKELMCSPAEHPHKIGIYKVDVDTGEHGSSLDSFDHRRGVDDEEDEA